MDAPKRFHPLMVVLHWLTLILLLGAGLLAGQGGPSPIRPHMIFGSLLLITMVIRLIARFTIKRPAWANTGNPFLNKLGELVHIGLYLVTFYILTMGGIIATQRNLIGYVLGSGAVERVDRDLHMFHQLGWWAIIGLLLLHIGGAVHHQFILKDNLLGRMWFGKR